MSFSVRLPEALESRLNHLAAVTNRSKSFYVRQLLEEHLEDLEDVYIADQRIEELRAGKSNTYTLQEAAKELGLDL